MTLDPAPWLALVRALGPDHERGALDTPAAAREAAALLLASAAWGSAEVHPWGLDLRAGGLWEPWRRAREAVERLPTEPQERGARTDYLALDRESGVLTLGWVGAWKPACPRFASRACPRMAPMGHESPHADCNYWLWPGMAGAVPGLELYPEWQRFDCHRHHPLFQWHLCGEALAQDLGAAPRWVVHGGPPDAGAALASYAALSSRPGAFEWKPLP